MGAKCHNDHDVVFDGTFIRQYNTSGPRCNTVYVYMWHSIHRIPSHPIRNAFRSV